jgi:hypothetical protein
LVKNEAGDGRIIADKRRDAEDAATAAVAHPGLSSRR